MENNEFNTWNEKLQFIGNYYNGPFQIDDLFLISNTRILSYSHSGDNLKFYSLCKEINSNKRGFLEALYRDQKNEHPILIKLKKGVYVINTWHGNAIDAIKSIYRLRAPNIHPISFFENNNNNIIVYDYFEKSRWRKSKILNKEYVIKKIPFLDSNKQSYIKRAYFTREYLFPNGISSLVIPYLLREYKKIIEGKETYNGFLNWLNDYKEKGSKFDIEVFFDNDIVKTMTEDAKKKLYEFKKEIFN